LVSTWRETQKGTRKGDTQAAADEQDSGGKELFSFSVQEMAREAKERRKGHKPARAG
jgi:hypothetical protein